MQFKGLSRWNQLAIATSLALAAPTALAAGFQLNELSPSLQGTALAGAAAATNDVTAMFFNPATLTTVKGTQTYLGLDAIMPNIDVKNTRASVTTPLGTGTVNGNSAENDIAPNAYVPDFYTAWDAGKNLKAGVAVTAPWGMATDYNDDWIGRNNALDSSLKSIDIAPTLAYKIDPMWSVGAAVHAQYLEVNYSNAAVSLTPGDGYKADLTGSSWGVGYTLGVLFTPRQGTNIGLSYRSQVQQNVNGTGYSNTQIGNFIPIVYAGSANTSITLPAVVMFSISQQVTDKWTALATAQWTQWSTFNKLDATLNSQSGPVTVDNQTNWHNTMLYSLGAQYQASPKWTLRGGVAYDESPIYGPYIDARIPDSNRYWATFGVGYQATAHLAADFVYEHIFMQNQSINISQTTNVPGNTIVNQIAADYSGSADIVGLGIRYTF